MSTEVYLEKDSPNTVFVKKKGATWDDFFKTLPMTLSKDCLVTGTKQSFCTDKQSSLKFYLNGARNDSLLEAEIKEGDRVLISFGKDNKEEIERQLKKLSEI